jgi:NitT/TauT family transport system permease protein
MKLIARSWQSWLALMLALVALATFPMGISDIPAPYVPVRMFSVYLLVIGAAIASILPLPAALLAVTLFICSHLSTHLLFQRLATSEGNASLAFFLVLTANWLLAWRCVSILSELKLRSKTVDGILRLVIPAIFGAWILILWEAVTRGFGIPFIILPTPSAIGARLASSIPTLWADVQQTVFKAVIFGYLVGCASGFAVAILADRIAFFRRGLLPIANLMSALPIIGVAPIMVMWFGFDWQSKAAVVIVMTFFPMLVNTIAGLSAAGSMERDLMRSYASDYWQTLTKLRLPAAMPFIFNALKINSTLALIGAIVAEFFGTPIVGMGFRISTEIGRMNVDMVWAEITVAALVGSIFYGVVALGERALTFWHPSNRGG